MDLLTAIVWLAGAFGVGLFIGLAWRPARATSSSRKEPHS